MPRLAGASGTDELALRIAARTTKELALRRGNAMGMYIGCGFPKSGTVWLCQLLGTALGVPYPRRYRSPIAMSSVVHAHWRYDRRLPPTAYIRRDGRDVMVSLYFFTVRAIRDTSRPRTAQATLERLRSVFGRTFDPEAVRENLPRFIELAAKAPTGSEGLAWHEHVADWWDRPGVAQLAYEELHSDPVQTIARVMGELGATPDKHIASLAVDRWSFETTSGRKPGDEDRQSFQRKGVAGDWANHFSREAAEVFDAIYGDALIELGYVDSHEWCQEL